VTRYQTLLLDLDDTLYPASSGVWEAIGDRIDRFMIEVVGIDAAQASPLRQFYFEHYGTSLNGLRLHHGIDPSAYLRYVHDVPLEDFILPDPELRRMIQGLAFPPVIFTNADAAHARRVLTALEVNDLIEQIIDIVALEWVNKPRRRLIARAALCVGSSPASSSTTRFATWSPLRSEWAPCWWDLPNERMGSTTPSPAHPICWPPSPSWAAQTDLLQRLPDSWRPTSGCRCNRRSPWLRTRAPSWLSEGRPSTGGRWVSVWPCESGSCKRVARRE
jgi:pyrimidine 5'-nucleotidase